MIDIIKLSLTLTIIGIFAALLIAFTNSKTSTKILEQKLLKESTSLQQIMPKGAVIKEMKSDNPQGPAQYWIGINGSDTSYAFKVSSQGYSSSIVSQICVDASGVVKGMNILDQGETPGLGTRVEEVITKNYIWNFFFAEKTSPEKPWFTQQFIGINILNDIAIEKNMGEWHTVSAEGHSDLKKRNAVTAITGSTISTRAVVKSITQQAKMCLISIKGN